jgi:hypothetical protein
MPDIEALRADYHRLIKSWDYAFAMGAGCTIEGGNVTRFQLVRQRAADLHALIKEHDE